MEVLKVLIVEDTPMAQRFCKKIIDDMPNTMSSVASDGQEALEKFKAGQFDLILMDIGLPILNGIEATRAIRQYEKEHNLPPVVIVALTANEKADIKFDCYASGMNHYLSKPFSTEKAFYIKERFFSSLLI
jgi:CheY-like chemotaxis protein